MTDYTPLKKEMTYRMVKFYCLSKHGGETLCDECKGFLIRALDRLQNCRYKERGYPCPQCPHCCTSGEEHEHMLEIVSYENTDAVQSVHTSGIFALRGIEDISEAEREYDPRYNVKRDGMKKAYLELIQTRPSAEISVSDVCRESGVSRGTFYSHYSTLTDLVDDCLFDLILQVDFLPSQAGFEKWKSPPAGEPFCVFIRRNPGYRALVFDSDLQEHVIEQINICSAPRFAHTFMGENLDVQKMTMVCNTAFRGCLHLIKENLDKSDEEWAVIKDDMDCFHLGGLRRVAFR